MYDTVEEVAQKIVNSVVLLDNEPVFICDGVGKKGNITLHYKTLPLDKGGHDTIQQKEMSYPGWDFRSWGQKLGYCEVQSPVNGVFDSVFLSRIPARHSRQGLDQRTVSLSTFDKDATGYTYQLNDVWYNGRGLTKTIRNEYLSPVMAYESVMKNSRFVRSVPIHRKISLMYDRISPPYLIYRNEKVGYTEDGIRFKLAEHKQYLKEELVDMIGLKVA